MSSASYIIESDVHEMDRMGNLKKFLEASGTRLELSPERESSTCDVKQSIQRPCPITPVNDVVMGEPIESYVEKHSAPVLVKTKYSAIEKTQERVKVEEEEEIDLTDIGHDIIELWVEGLLSQKVIQTCIEAEGARWVYPGSIVRRLSDKELEWLVLNWSRQVPGHISIQYRNINNTHTLGTTSIQTEYRNPLSSSIDSSRMRVISPVKKEEEVKFENESDDDGIECLEGPLLVNPDVGAKGMEDRVWNESEVRQLRKMIRKYGTQDWKSIQKEMSTQFRTDRSWSIPLLKYRWAQERVVLEWFDLEEGKVMGTIDKSLATLRSAIFTLGEMNMDDNEWRNLQKIFDKKTQGYEDIRLKWFQRERKRLDKVPVIQDSRLFFYG